MTLFVTASYFGDGSDKNADESKEQEDDEENDEEDEKEPLIVFA